MTLSTWLIIIVGLFITWTLLYALFVYVSRRTYARYWISQNNKDTAGGSIKIVGLGDSTIQGIGATNISKGLIGGLARKVSAKYAPVIVRLYNYSKTGAIAEDIIKHQLIQPGAKDAIKSADVIIISVGSNDFIKNVPLATFIQQYEKVLQSLPVKKVVIASIPPIEMHIKHAVHVQEWNEQLAVIAARYNVTVAPVYEKILPHFWNWFMYSGDFFHPSNLGYRYWIDAFYEPVIGILNNNYGK